MADVALDRPDAGSWEDPVSPQEARRLLRNWVQREHEEAVANDAGVWFDRWELLKLLRLTQIASHDEPDVSPGLVLAILVTIVAAFGAGLMLGMML